MWRGRHARRSEASTKNRQGCNDNRCTPVCFLCGGEGGIRFRKLRPGDYGKQLNLLVRSNEPERAVDRLLIAGLIEARSCERFKLLKEHVARMEEARRRDHRKLGKELDLFCFSELVGPGLPLFTPKGTIIKEELQKHLEAMFPFRDEAKESTVKRAKSFNSLSPFAANSIDRFLCWFFSQMKCVILS